jgi:hypothetical protein
MRPIEWLPASRSMRGLIRPAPPRTPAAMRDIVKYCPVEGRAVGAGADLDLPRSTYEK